MVWLHGGSLAFAGSSCLQVMKQKKTMKNAPMIKPAYSGLFYTQKKAITPGVQAIQYPARHQVKPG